MFFILSKVLFVLVMPLTIITACFMISLFAKPSKIKRKFFITGIVLFLLFSNEFIINEIFLIWESPPTPFSEINHQYDLAIILTGVADLTPPLNDRVFFNKGADRIIHPLYLYNQGKISQFLIAGGSGAIFRKDRPESEILARFLKTFNVPEQDILIESNSRNTHQSAVNVAKMIVEDFGNQPILLVTSAFHMRRSLACFKKANLNVIPFTTDFYGQERRFTLDRLLIPSTGALKKWTIFIHEMIGIIAYKLLGYI